MQIKVQIKQAADNQYQRSKKAPVLIVENKDYRLLLGAVNCFPKGVKGVNSAFTKSNN